jgi:hypothetical protein
MTTAGVVAGGWAFVTAAYLVTLLVLGAYTASVVARYRAEARRAARDRARSEESR